MLCRLEVGKLCLWDALVFLALNTVKILNCCMSMWVLRQGRPCKRLAGFGEALSGLVLVVGRMGLRRRAVQRGCVNSSSVCRRPRTCSLSSSLRRETQV